jgi:hypothetical protein
MPGLPRDIADVNLAPVALAVDARIEELTRLSAADLSFQIALRSDIADWTLELREASLLAAIGRNIALHEWELSIDQRGVRMTHRENTLVLGLPDSIRAYLSGS